MPLFARFTSLLHHFSKRQEQERDLNEEVCSYIDLLTQEGVDAGMDEASARRAALLKLGGREQIKEEIREVQTGAWIDTLLQDVRYGLRMLGNNPGFSALVILTLALGIGANTAIFSVVYSVLLRPLPYSDGSQLVVLHQQAAHANFKNVPFSVKEVADYRNQSHTLADTVEYHSMAFLLLGENSAERVETGVVSANFFDVLGVRPLLGRTFLPIDETVNADAVLVLSYQYWQRHCGGDPNIVGK